MTPSDFLDSDTAILLQKTQVGANRLGLITGQADSAMKVQLCRIHRQTGATVARYQSRNTGHDVEVIVSVPQRHTLR